jgi:hypothetical protein
MLTEDEGAIARSLAENIELAEAAHGMLEGKAFDFLSGGVEAAFKDSAEAFGWTFGFDTMHNDNNHIASDAWYAGEFKNSPYYDLCFGIWSEGESEYHMTDMLGIGENSMRIQAFFEISGVLNKKRFLKEHDLIITKLTDAGFRFNASSSELYIQVIVPRADMMRAFSEVDHDLIKVHFVKALDLIHSHEDDFNALAIGVRSLRLAASDPA